MCGIFCLLISVVGHLEPWRIKPDTKPTQAATYCHMINLPWTPNIVTDSESPIKLLLVGVISGGLMGVRGDLNEGVDLMSLSFIIFITDPLADTTS